MHETKFTFAFKDLIAILFLVIAVGGFILSTNKSISNVENDVSHLKETQHDIAESQKLLIEIINKHLIESSAYYTELKELQRKVERYNSQTNKKE